MKRRSRTIATIWTVVATPLLTCSVAPCRGERPAPIYWDGPWLEEARVLARDGDERILPAVERLRRDAQRALRAGPFSVVNKEQLPPSGDKHDYMSLGPYWWPNPDTASGLPYVRRDGERYPGIREVSDRGDLGRMSQAVETLALAYHFTGEERFAERAALVVRTWFLEEATKMNPHLEYGQAIRGVNDGRGFGIIETRSLVDVVEGVTLLTGSPSWTHGDQRELVAWFDQYLDWLHQSDHGRDERAAKNNHGTYYDIQVAAFAHHTGRSDLRDAVLREVGPRRIAVQIEPDGRQPLELKRTKAWSYSVGNLTGLVTLAEMGRRVGIDLWSYETDDGRSICQAIDFLAPYALDERTWDYQQLGGWSPAPFFPVLRTAAMHLDGRYTSQLAEIPPQESSSRARLLHRPPEFAQHVDP